MDAIEYFISEVDASVAGTDNASRVVLFEVVTSQDGSYPTAISSEEPT